MKKRIDNWLFLFGLLFLTVGAAAQTAPAAFTLEEARQYALQNAYVLRNTRIDIGKAQKKVWETITTGLPQVTGTAAYNKFLNLPVSLIPGEFFGEPAGTYIPVKFGQDYSSDFGFTVSQMIFDGSYIVGVGSSKIYLALAQQAHERTEIDIRHAVTQAYYMVLIGQENLKVMQENLANTQKLLAETRAYYENGFREEQDVDQMQLLVRSAENEVLKAGREVTIAKVVLQYSMGMEMEQEIILSDPLAKFLDPLVKPAAATGRFDFATHIDYRLSETQFQAAQKLLNLEKSSFLPRI
ncbi:MAG TPA: TolC family protein, partial [Prolixibacteraceae bacterium]|nr:TolC family protein [Prolixibacteraceae bacterium]